MHVVHSHFAPAMATAKRVVKSRYEQNAEEWNEENWQYATKGDLGERLRKLEKQKPGTIEKIRRETQFI